MKTTSLYNGDVELVFNEGNHRYTVNGDVKPGVTSILKVINKPALAEWFKDEALKYALGRYGFDNENGRIWMRSDKIAAIKAGQAYTEEELTLIAIEAASAHTKRSDKGKDVGKETHSLIEGYLSNVKEGLDAPVVPKATPEAKKAYKAFTDWFESQDIKVLDIERVVYSLFHGYCGTFDCLLEIDGKKVLCDVKTTNPSREAPNGIYSEYFLQLGAYSQAYSEEAFHTQQLMREKRLTSAVDDLMIINCSKTGNLATLRASELGITIDDCERAFLSALSLSTNLSKIAKAIKEAR